MNLQFLLPEVPGLGVWQVDTGSINSIININSTAELIKNIYKRIAMIPLLLTLEPKEVNNPTDGKKQTVFCLNLRVNMKIGDLALLARKQTELLELPIGEDEAPDFAPEFEPDPVALPEHTPDTVADLWPEDKKPAPVVQVEESEPTPEEIAALFDKEPKVKPEAREKIEEGSDVWIAVKLKELGVTDAAIIDTLHTRYKVPIEQINTVDMHLNFANLSPENRADLLKLIKMKEKVLSGTK